ncbi:hypothetical protein VTI74DRAFT_4765 [Chaetomium olivicolor]
MCQNRIFSRLGSQRFSARYHKIKTFFGSPARQVLDAVHANGWNIPGPETERFVKGTQELLQRLDTLEACQESEAVYHIKSVLRAAHRLSKSTDFDGVFSGVTSRELNPSTRTGFITRLTKLARYQECSYYLCRTARRFGLFEDAQVIVVSLDAQLFARTLTLPAGNCLDQCLSRCQSDGPAAFRTKAIKSRLGTDDASFLSTVQRYLCESRVHAEVQIVCYNELHPSARKPRVICSSKDACYLCNLFIKLHGMFNIPKTHGNFYPGWRLLPLPAFDNIQVQLNDLMEARIRELLRRAMVNPKLTLPLPQNANESTVFLFPTALPTPASSVVLEGSENEFGGVQETEEPEGAPEAERLYIPQPSLGTRPQRATPGTPNRESLRLEIADDRPPMRQRSPPFVLQLPSPESPRDLEVPCSPVSKTPDEPAIKLSGHDEESGEAARPPPKESIQSSQVGACEQLQLESEPDLDVVAESGLGPSRNPDEVQEQPVGTAPGKEAIQESTPASELGPVSESEAVAEPGPVSPPNPKTEPRPAPSPYPDRQLLVQAAGSEFPPELKQQTQAAPRRQPTSNPELKPGPASAPKLTPSAAWAALSRPRKPPSTAGQPSPQPVPATPTPSPPSGPAPTPPPPPAPILLTRNQPLRLHLTNLTSSTPLPILTTATGAGQIRVYPELIRSVAQSRARSATALHIHWLPRRRAAAFYVARPRGFVDLALGPKGVEVDVESSEGVYLTYQGEVVMMEIIRGRGMGRSREGV